MDDIPLNFTALNEIEIPLSLLLYPGNGYMIHHPVVNAAFQT